MERVEQSGSMIAWFCLAEAVKKGEKERALVLNRLLAHSVTDKAVALQLEGDILSAFRDTRALDKYLEATHVYKRNMQNYLFLWLTERVFFEAINLLCYDYARRIVYQDVLSDAERVTIARNGVEIILLSKNKKTISYTTQEHVFLDEMIKLGKTIILGCEDFVSLVTSYDECFE